MDKLLEISKPGILASIGGVGKSMMALDLAIKVSQGSGMWFDHPILKGGNVVILSAEDDLVEIHRRINALDKGNKRFDAPYDVFTHTITGQPETLMRIRDESQGLQSTGQDRKR